MFEFRAGTTFVTVRVTILGFFSGKYCDGNSPELAGANGSSVPAARLLVVGFEAIVEKLGPKFRRKVRDVRYRKSRRRWTTQSTIILYSMSKNV